MDLVNAFDWQYIVKGKAFSVEVPVDSVLRPTTAILSSFEVYDKISNESLDITDVIYDPTKNRVKLITKPNVIGGLDCYVYGVGLTDIEGSPIALLQDATMSISVESNPCVDIVVHGAKIMQDGIAVPYPKMLSSFDIVVDLENTTGEELLDKTVAIYRNGIPFKSLKTDFPVGNKTVTFHIDSIRWFSSDLISVWIM